MLATLSSTVVPAKKKSSKLIIILPIVGAVVALLIVGAFFSCKLKANAQGKRHPHSCGYAAFEFFHSHTEVVAIVDLTETHRRSSPPHLSLAVVAVNGAGIVNPAAEQEAKGDPGPEVENTPVEPFSPVTDKDFADC